MRISKTKTIVLITVLGAALIAPSASRATAATPDYVPGEILVRFQGEPERVLELPGGVGIGEAARSLRANPAVDYANPNYIAHASAVPNDPGRRGEPRGWRR